MMYPLANTASRAAHRLLLLVLALLSFGISPAGAATRNVPGSFSNIQAAIDASSSGDTVLVANGTYSGTGNVDLDFGGKNITVKSVNGAATTIINCAGTSGSNHRAFVFQTGETSAAVVQGFTIENGYSNNGGAISIAGSNNATGPRPTITQCVFLNNASPSAGGAIFINQAQPTITQCGFFGNTAGIASTQTGFGGAIEIQTNDPANPMPVSIANCVFDGNLATYDGGAIDITGLDATHPTVSVVNSSFTRNNANGYIDGSFAGIVTAPSAGQIPGAIDLFFGAVNITNSILYGDTYNGSTASEISTLNPGTSGNNGTAAVDHSDVQGGFAGTGNIDAAPLFVNAAGGDLRIPYNSPAVNVGTTTGAPANDYSGITRDANPDMGAYEYAVVVNANLISAQQGNLFSGPVAAFNDTGGDTIPLGVLSAQIDWGDGSGASAGTITQPGGVGTAYAVSGSHTYASTGMKTLTVTITATPTNPPAVTGSGTGTATVTAAPATHFSVTASSPQIAGTPFNYTVTALDASNNPAPGYTGTVHFTSTDGAAILPVDYTFVVGDNGSHTFSATLKTAGSQTITATDTATSSITGTSSGITVNPGAATHFMVSASSPQTAGTAFNYTVTALDASNNTATGYTGTVHFTSTDGQAVLPADYTFVVGDSGQHVFSVTLKTAGSQTVTATDTVTNTLTGTSNAITVNPGGTSKFFVSAPASATAGSAISVTVTAQDAFGNTTPAYAGTVHFTSTDGQATLPADSSLTNGAGTFSVTLKTAGGQTVTATDTVTNTLTGTSSTITVSPDTATHFTVSATPAAITAGTTITATVTAQDAFGNTATGYAGMVHFTSTDAQATLPADAALTNGVGTFNVTLGTVGGQTVTATDTVTPGITGTSNTVTVSPDTATHFAVSATPASITAGGATSVTVTAQDAYGNTATGYAGTVHFTSTDGQAVLPADVTLTSGVGTFSVTLKTAGNQTLTATDTAAPGITGTSNTVTVSPAAATHYSVAAPSTATAGSAISVTVTALDAYGNTATGYAGTAHFTSTDGGATLPADSALTNGVGTFSVTFITAGNQTLTATDSVTPGITGASNAITVNAAAATHYTVSAIPAAITAGGTTSVTVTAQDAYGNTATGYTGTVHFTSTDGQAILPADSSLTNGVGTFSVTLKTAGGQTVTATDTVTNTITGTSNSVTVSPNTTTHYVVVAPSTATAGSAVTVTVTAQDAYGNTDTNYAGVVHFTSTDGQAVLPADSTLTNGVGSFSATLKTAGSQTVTATDSVTPGITGVSGAISVTSAAATHFAVSAPATATAGTPISVTVTALDDFGNTDTAYAGTIHFTSSDSGATLPADTPLTNGAGNFSATLTTAGPQTITATDTTTATITGTSGTITVSADVVATLSFAQPPASPQTQDAALTPDVTVEARDQFNNVVPNAAVAIVLASSSTGVGTLTGTSPQTTDASGIATFNDLVIDQPGSYAVEASSNGHTVDSSEFTVNPAVVTSLVFTQQPTDTQAGQGINAGTTPVGVIVHATDAAGSTVPGVTVTVSLSTGTGTLSGTASQTTDASGDATFTALSIDRVGSKNLTAANSGGASQESAAFQITPALATHFSVAAPSAATAGAAFSVSVTALDQFGNTDTNYAGTARFFSTDTLATLPADSTLISGVGQFTVTLRTAGAQRVTATDTASASITGTSSAIVVGSAASGSLAFVQQPTTTTAGAVISPAPTVKVIDAFGNAVPGVNVTVSLAAGTGALGGTLTQATDAQGVATFSGLTPDRPGQKTLLAATPTNLTAASQPFVVTTNDVIDAKGVNVSAVKRVAFTGPVATFTDSNTTSPASDFAATVDWGDGTPQSAGAVTGDTGAFTVSGTHAYATEGIYTVTTRITDTQPGGPNLTPTSTATVKDITAPTTTAALDPASPNGGDGFYTVPVKVTLSATDPDNAPGELTTFYRVDSGALQTYTAPFTVSGDFEHLVTFYSKDSADNTEVTPGSVTFKIDSTPPVTTGTSRAVPTGEEVTLAARDDVSGPAGTTYAVDGGSQTAYGGPFVVTGEGTHTVAFSSVDKAGNAESPKSLSVTVAVVPPPTPAVLHTFPAGLQMISAPEDYTGVSNDAALGTPGVKLAVWQPGAMQYVLSPQPPADALHLGQGYWARFRSDAPLSDLGRPADATKPFSIALSKGWNMIGDPFFAAVPFGDLSVLAGGKSYDLGTANSRALVYSTLYAYPAGSTQYQTVSGAGGSLAPYTGYWIYAFADCTLSVSPTHVSR